MCNEINRELTTSEKITIINALLQQDREEIRFYKTILINVTVIFITGMTAISTYFIQQHFNPIINPLIGPTCLITLYICIPIVYFLLAWRICYFVKSGRTCLEMREAHFKEPSMLTDYKKFMPLMTEKDFDKLKKEHETPELFNSIPDNYFKNILLIAGIALALNIIVLYVFYNSNIPFLKCLH